MDFFDNNCFRINKTLLTIVGQWPFQSPRQKFLIRIFSFIAIVSLLIPEIICYCELWGDDFDKILERTLPLLTTCIYGLKGINSVVNENKIRQLLNTIKSDWGVLSSEPELEILKTYAEKGKSKSVKYTTYVGCTTFIYLFPPMVPYILDSILPLNETRSRKFIYETDYGLEDNEKYFFFIMMHEYIAAYAKISTALASDVMFVLFVQHACGIFSSLGHKLENIAVNQIEYGKDILEQERQIYQEIIICVDRHKKVIEFYTIFEDAFAFNYLMQLAVTMIIISLIGLEVTMNLDKPHEAIRFILFLVGHMFSFFFISLLSQQLMDHSLLMRDKVYFSKWYAMSTKCKRLLLIMMMRSLEPCQLTAGKIYVLNMESYSTVIRASMSYFTMLTSMR